MSAERFVGCEAFVWGQGYWHKFPCKRRAVETVSGKDYCKQHAKIARKYLLPPVPLSVEAEETKQ